MMGESAGFLRPVAVPENKGSVKEKLSNARGKTCLQQLLYYKVRKKVG